MWNLVKRSQYLKKKLSYFMWCECSTDRCKLASMSRMKELGSETWCGNTWTVNWYLCQEWRIYRMKPGAVVIHELWIGVLVKNEGAMGWNLLWQNMNDYLKSQEEWSVNTEQVLWIIVRWRRYWKKEIKAPLDMSRVQRWCCHHTIYLSWHLSLSEP